MKLNNDVCLVTGATRGIGRAIATALASAGGIVVGTATSTDGAQSIESYLMEQGLKGSGATLDVTNTEAVNTLVAEITETHGAPTILVNNAGITRDNLLLRMKEEDWDAVMDTDLKSIYRVTKSCLRGMTKARNGRIINITSVVAALGNAGQCNYAAAKAGIIGFTKSLAAEVAPRGITVNAVAPGFIDTDMTRGLSDAQKEQLLQRIPIGRLGSAGDVSNAVLFLASEASQYITGETLHVNGGMYMSH